MSQLEVLKVLMMVIFIEVITYATEQEKRHAIVGSSEPAHTNDHLNYSFVYSSRANQKRFSF